MNFVVRTSLLELRCWNFVVGTSLLELRCWNFVVGTSFLELRCWNFVFGTSLLELRFWNFVFGTSLLELRCWKSEMDQYKLKFPLRSLLVQFIHENHMRKAYTRNENEENSPCIIG